MEVYHTSHDRWETEAPITAFAPVDVGGRPSIVAGYGCSPLAVFERAALTSERHLRGRTVAEIGGGNRPIDVVAYEKEGRSYLLVANSHRTLTRFAVDDIAIAPAMTTPVSRAYEPGGVPYLPVAATGVMQLDDFGPDAFVLLQRDSQTGDVVLSTLRKEWL